MQIKAMTPASQPATYFIVHKCCNVKLRNKVGKNKKLLGYGAGAVGATATLPVPGGAGPEDLAGANGPPKGPTPGPGDPWYPIVFLVL